MKLSILICTVEGREHFYASVYSEFMRQIIDNGYDGMVEILSHKDAKKISVGSKRQLLLEQSKGEYIVYFDDDDWAFPFYLTEVMTALEKNPDCVGFLIHMTTNGRKPQTCCHSLRFKEWANNRAGYDYVRNVTHFNPVKRSLAIQVGFKDIRFGEDKDYSDRLTPLCQNEVFIPRKLFHYRYVHEDSKTKYGITE